MFYFYNENCSRSEPTTSNVQLSLRSIKRTKILDTCFAYSSTWETSHVKPEKQESKTIFPSFPLFHSLGFRLLNLHIGKNPHEVDNLGGPPPLLSSTKHQECVCTVGIQAHENMP